MRTMRTDSSAEQFRPIQHIAADSLLNGLVFHLRRCVDLQFNSVYRDMARILPGVGGRVLDVGCGNSPFASLLDGSAEYTGLDVESAVVFGYYNPKVIFYDGKTMPFQDGAFDFIICSEVLEHVEKTAPFIAEIHRVLRTGGTAVFTVPWSARFHHIPHDYYRFTPSALESIFAGFAVKRITARGTEVSAIATKFVVLNARLLLGGLRPTRWVAGLIPGLLLLPVTAIAVLLGQLGIYLRLGADVDPLGYTIELTK